MYRIFTLVTFSPQKYGGVGKVRVRLLITKFLISQVLNDSVYQLKLKKKLI